MTVYVCVCMHVHVCVSPTLPPFPPSFLPFSPHLLTLALSPSSLSPLFRQHPLSFLIL